MELPHSLLQAMEEAAIKVEPLDPKGDTIWLGVVDKDGNVLDQDGNVIGRRNDRILFQNVSCKINVFVYFVYEKQSIIKYFSFEYFVTYPTMFQSSVFEPFHSIIICIFLGREQSFVRLAGVFKYGILHYIVFRMNTYYIDKML